MNLSELYQDVILDHGKRPRNFGDLPTATHEAEGFNPLCGDQLHLRLLVKGGLIADVMFNGCGCAISTASASMLTQAIKGKSVEHARDLFARFHRAAMSGDAGEDALVLGDLVSLIGVHQYANRVKCATLAWHALHAAIEQTEQSVTTE